jgi:Radical SAM superfamily
MHSDFDRARQISHYWRRRNAKTVIGGSFARLFPKLCAPYFDAVTVGDPEHTVPRVFDDFCRGELKPYYAGNAYAPELVPTPRFELAADCQWLPLGIEATRGCPFRCDFCVLTAMGTGFHTRPADRVVGDLRTGIATLRKSVGSFRSNIAIFYDNNLAGNFAWLRQLCAKLEPLGIRWGCSLTFNAACNRELVATMARAGCGFMYVGIESFNPWTLVAMNKQHNVVRKTGEMIAFAHEHGILVTAGLMVSPLSDDVEYVRSIPRHLEQCRLDVPTYICFETPFPGTALFARVAAMPDAAFLPNALLRDFNTYTLVVRPRHADLEEFVGAYKDVLAQVYAPLRRVQKVMHDACSLIPSGGWKPLLADAIDQWTTDLRPDFGRSYIAGSDRTPPETGQVPLTEADFADEPEQRRIMDPWPVTDAAGRLHPNWHTSDGINTVPIPPSPSYVRTVSKNARSTST